MTWPGRALPRPFFWMMEEAKMNNPVDMTGKVAIVTGAGMGMGAATAELFAAQGAAVLVADIDEAAARRTADSIAQAHGRALPFRLDVADESAVAAMVAAAVDAFGRVDCAVNNAAIKPDTHPIDDADMAEFDRIIAVNLRGVMLCLKYQIAQMLRQGGKGAIVNIGSVSSQRPQPMNAAYVASKHGVIGLTKVASLDYAPRGIRVNAVMPGAIDTPMIRQSLADYHLTEADFAPQLSLLNRFGQPGEVAQASLWLCSDAASFVTGHALAVDAGYLSR